MPPNLIPTLEYILAIKEDIRKAINSRGGVVTGGVPFEQWGSILAGLVFDEDTVQYPGTKPVKPTPALPVVTPINSTDLPSDFDIGTSGLTPIAVGFAYGALQFDFTGAVGSVEEIIHPDSDPEPEPEPEPTPEPEVPSITGRDINVNEWFGANPTSLPGGTQLYGSRITAVYQIIVPPEPNDRVVILDTHIPFSTDNFACSVGLERAEGTGTFTIPANVSRFSFTSTIFSANLEYVFLAKLRLGQAYTSPFEPIAEPEPEPVTVYRWKIDGAFFSTPNECVADAIAYKNAEAVRLNSLDADSLVPPWSYVLTRIDPLVGNIGTYYFDVSGFDTTYQDGAHVLRPWAVINDPNNSAGYYRLML